MSGSREDVDEARPPVEVTGLSATGGPRRIVVTVATNLDDADPTLYYHWYVNGRWVGVTTQNTRRFHVEDYRRQIEINCVATRWSRFDYRRHAPVQYHGHPELSWIRSVDSDVKHYLCQYQKDGGDWTTFAKVEHRPVKWGYRITTPLLDDGSTYAFQVLPVDTSEVEGTPLAIETLTVVRVPAAVGAAITWDSGTGQVTFT